MTEQSPAVQEATPESSVDQAVAQGGAYEVLRRRLGEQGARLREIAGALNEQRLAEFGDSRLEVIGRLRIQTENNCIGRDIVRIGGLLLFGYNVFIGLKKTARGRRIRPVPAGGGGGRLRRGAGGHGGQLSGRRRASSATSGALRLLQARPPAAAARGRGQAAGRLPDRPAQHGRARVPLGDRPRTATSPTSTTAASATSPCRRHSTSSGRAPRARTRSAAAFRT